MVSLTLDIEDFAIITRKRVKTSSSKPSVEDKQSAMACWTVGVLPPIALFLYPYPNRHFPKAPV
jgi:hypothetical protein